MGGKVWDTIDNEENVEVIRGSPECKYIKDIASQNFLPPEGNIDLYCSSTGSGKSSRLLREYNEYYNSDAKFGMHQFRHTFCTMLYNADVDIKTAQFLGILTFQLL